jgi:hypothetical protein
LLRSHNESEIGLLVYQFYGLTEEGINNYEANEYGLHWEDIDEDLSFEECQRCKGDIDSGYRS